MNQKEDQYFNINRILLLAVGLWPYQQSIFTRFQHIFISGIMTTFIIFQLTSFLTIKCTSELFIKILSSASFFIVFLIKYNAFCFHLEGVKNLLMQLQYARNQLKDKNEIAIIKKYDYISTRYTIGITILGICGVIICIIMQYWSTLSNINLTTNTSQLHNFVFMMEYFIDQEKYFYLTLLHITVALCIGTTSMVAIGAMLIAYLHHTCGMFRIANYRIEHAININIIQNITPKNKILITQGIIYAVDIHRQAMKLTKNFMSVLEVMMFFLILCGVACLSCNLFQIASSELNIKKCLVPSVFALVCIIYMFLANHIGQIVIDNSNRVFATVYNVQWYKTPLHVQKMILFLLQRRSKEFNLNVGGVYDASMEGFATLVKASLSYFTFIYSTR